MQGAYLLHLLVVGGGRCHQQQHALAAAISLLKAHLIAQAGNSGCEIRGIALGKGSGAGIGTKQPQAGCGGTKTSLQSQGQGEQSQALETELDTPKPLGSCCQGALNRRQCFSFGAAQIGGEH